MNFHRFEHVNKICQNLDATRKFYQTLFPDWYVRVEGEAEGWRWMHFGGDHFYLALNQPPAGSNDAPLSTGNIDHIGFVIDDGDKMKTLLETAGIEFFTQPAPETKHRIYVFDPDGVCLELVEYEKTYALR